MWGQGLPDQSKFAYVAARQLADKLGFGEHFAVRMLARSGAIVPWYRDQVYVQQRSQFVEQFPELFNQGKPATDAFVTGTAQPSSGLPPAQSLVDAANQA